jgi:hypothetical protein
MTIHYDYWQLFKEDKKYLWYISKLKKVEKRLKIIDSNGIPRTKAIRIRQRELDKFNLEELHYIHFEKWKEKPFINYDKKYPGINYDPNND